ncbi:MAG: hypothetical protein WA711_23350, partial [Pseudolabrys sp.]
PCTPYLGVSIIKYGGRRIIKDEGSAMIAQPAVMRLYATSCVAPIFLIFGLVAGWPMRPTPGA